ncbi:MAG: hypothetical protein V3S32_05845 [Acidimicrobiia bacterium]
MKRIVVIGNSSSGKTTSSRKLATLLDVPLLELDGVFHQPDWTELPDDQFRSRVARFTDNDRWVVDGNYTSHGMRDVLWPKADSIVWLDMPKSVVMRRVVARTIRRAACREELWNGNREPWTNLYSRDPEKNIAGWAWTRFDHVRDKYERCMSTGTWAHADLYRLRSPRKVDRFLAHIDAETPSHRTNLVA